MGKFVDLTGQRFGRLTVIERAPNKGRRTMWLCKCDCGTEKVICQEDLHSGKTVSCGCYLLEKVTKHGLYKTKEYRRLASMKDRCSNPNATHAHRYGGRGIKVCDEWRSDPKAFYEYVSKLPHFRENGYTLNRINNDGDYEPGNVEWADSFTQMNNTSKNHLIEYNGEIKSITQWARIKNLPIDTVRSRIRRKWSTERALETPICTKPKKHIVVYDGKEYSITELSKLLNIPRTTLNNKINAGMSISGIVKNKQC
jgi:hypothetical protein